MCDDIEKKHPRLFYFDEGENFWTPWRPEIAQIELDCMQDGERRELALKRVDMTDREFAAIPEG